MTAPAVPTTVQQATFAEAVQAAMAQEMARDQAVFAYGEGINDPSGFFGTTVGLAERFGAERCFDVPNSEEALVGFGLGAALGGLRPVFVNLRIEFLLLAVNQLVNHAAKWGAMQGRDDLSAPLTLRAMVGRGWGQGAQHSGSYAAMFAHVPGLHVAVPSSPARGASLVVTAVRGSTPTLLIEPKAAYDAGPGPAAAAAEPLEIGRAHVDRPGSDITLVAVGDGVARALGAAERLAADGVEAEVVDACWFRPFDAGTVLASVRRTGVVGVLDIGWDDYGLAAQVAKTLAMAEPGALRRRMLSWAPQGHAPAGCFAEADHYPSTERVVADVRQLLR